MNKYNIGDLVILDNCHETQHCEVLNENYAHKIDGISCGLYEINEHCVREKSILYKVSEDQAKEINKLYEKLKEAVKKITKVNEERFWELKEYKDMYFYYNKDISHKGSIKDNIMKAQWENDSFDSRRMKSGNVFKTREGCEKYAKHYEYLFSMGVSNLLNAQCKQPELMSDFVFSTEDNPKISSNLSLQINGYLSDTLPLLEAINIVILKIPFTVEVKDVV